MQSSLFQTVVPTSIRSLGNLTAILEKARAHAEARKLDPTALLGFRLYPDMLSFSRQVQIATDTASSGAARLAGVEVPIFESNETTFADLIGRVQKTIAFLQTLKSAQIDGAEDRTVSWQTRSSTKSMLGHAYALDHVLPNLFFHVTTAYNILRHNGVELGKMDFLGRT